MRDFIYLLLIVILASVLVCHSRVKADEFNDQIMDIPTKCEYRRSKVREIENKYADVMYKTWCEQGEKPSAKLKDLAIYTASYVLLDNGITCRRIK